MISKFTCECCGKTSTDPVEIKKCEEGHYKTGKIIKMKNYNQNRKYPSSILVEFETGITDKYIRYIRSDCS